MAAFFAHTANFAPDRARDFINAVCLFYVDDSTLSRRRLDPPRRQQSGRVHRRAPHRSLVAPLHRRRARYRLPRRRISGKTPCIFVSNFRSSTSTATRRRLRRSPPRRRSQLSPSHRLAGCRAGRRSCAPLSRRVSQGYLHKHVLLSTPRTQRN